MRLRGAFNIFLVLVLVAVGVYFVVGGSSMGHSFTTPTDSQDITRTNTTFTITFNSTWKNVSWVNVYNITSYGTYTALNMTHNISLINGLPTNITDYNTSVSFIINAYNFTQGNYTFTVLIANNSNVSGNLNGGFDSLGNNRVNFTYVNISVIIDNVAPKSLLLLAPNISRNFSDVSSIQFGFNVTDSMSGNSTRGNSLNCSLYIQGNGTVLTYVNHSIVIWNSTDYQPTYWFNVSSTSIDSGYHVWNVSCADYNNNVNRTARWDGVIGGSNGIGGSGGYFNLADTIGPTTSAPTLSASSVTEGGSVTITCTGTDSITANPTEKISIRGPLNANWQEGIGTSQYTFTGTNDVGTYTSKCYSIDTAGMQGGPSAETTFAVTRTTTSSTTSTGGGGGGGTVSVSVLTGQTRDLGAIAEGGEGIINAYQASTVTFTVTTSGGGATISSHSIEFDEVNYIEGTATVIISSDPITLTLNVGDVKNVDLDNDGTDDLEVNLVSIDENGKVNLKIKDVTGAVTAEEEAGEEVTPTTEEAKAGVSWIWWILIVIVVVVIIALILPKKK